MCMTSDPYAAGYRFARSAFTGGPTRDIYIYTVGLAKARPNYYLNYFSENLNLGNKSQWSNYDYFLIKRR